MKKIVLLMLIARFAHADMIEPSHHCAKPPTPSQFASEAERVAFNRQVGLYRQCLADFIDEQTREARLHGDAARKAADELQRPVY